MDTAAIEAGLKNYLRVYVYAQDAAVDFETLSGVKPDENNLRDWKTLIKVFPSIEGIEDSHSGEGSC